MNMNLNVLHYFHDLASLEQARLIFDPAHLLSEMHNQLAPFVSVHSAYVVHQLLNNNTKQTVVQVDNSLQPDA